MDNTANKGTDGNGADLTHHALIALRLLSRTANQHKHPELLDSGKQLSCYRKNSPQIKAAESSAVKHDIDLKFGIQKQNMLLYSGFGGVQGMQANAHK